VADRFRAEGVEHRRTGKRRRAREEGSGAQIVIGARRKRDMRALSAPAVLAALLVASDAGLHAAPVRVADDRSWPRGTDVVPFEYRRGQILVKATLTSPSGRDTTGVLIMDTGAPALALGVSVWNALSVDSVEVGLGYMRRIRRSLTALDMGSARVTDLAVGGVVVDSVLGPGELGLFPPSFYQDRAVVLDYAAQRLAIVNRRLSLVTADTAAQLRGGSLGVQAHISQSHSRYAEILGPAAVALPFHRFEGGRLLVSARVAEPSRNWQSPPLTLLLDTGASACVLFDDVDPAALQPSSRWPRQTEVLFSSVLGTHRHDAVVLPTLLLTESSPPLQQRMVAARIVARKSLPDLQGEIPERVDGLLGNSFLERFRVVLDYGNDVAWLEPRAAPTQNASMQIQGAQVGVHVERVWGELRIAAVVPGSPAQEAGIRPGDLLVGIDQVRVGSFEVEVAERLLSGTPGSEIVLAVRHDGLEQVMRLKRLNR
jgi:hypothetical protein